MASQFKKLAKNSMVYSLGNLSTKLLGIVLLPIYTSHLSVADYGVLGILEVSAQFLIAVLGLNLYRALVRWYWDPEYKDKQRAIFFTLLSFLVLFVLLVEILLFVNAAYFARLLFDDSGKSYLIRLMIISAGLEIIFRIPLTLMRVQERPFLYSLSNIAKLIVSATLTIYFILALGKKVEGIYEAQIMGALVFLLLIIPYVIKNLQVTFLSKAFKEMFWYSFPLVFSSISGLLLTIADRFFLKFMSGLADVGIYSLGFKIGNSIKVFLVQSILLALSPIIYKMMDQPDNKSFYARIMVYLGSVVMMSVVVLSLFGRELVELLAKKPQYILAQYIIPIIAMGGFFGMLKEVALTGINIMKKTKALAMLITGAAILNVLLNYFLIPYFQSLGAAIATLLTQIILFSQIYLYAQKHYFIPYELRKISLMLILALMIISVGFCLNMLPMTPRIVLKAVLAILFLFSLYGTKLISKKELMSIWHLFGKNR